MQLGEKAARKWVDYSDESEEQPNSDEDRPTRPTNRAQHPSASTNAPVDHRSEQFIQQQLARYERARQNSQEIWLLVESDDQPLLDRKMRDIKQNGNKDVINIYMSRDIKGAWDIKLREEAVASWIKDGIDHRKNIKITVGDRNFKNRERGDRPRDRGDRGERGDRGDRGDRRGRDRGQRGGRRGGGRDRGDRDGRRNRDGNTEPQKKKVYVDKATGQAPTNKQECEQKVLQEKERHYTRQEAERVGAGLGNFRNKPKVQVKVETPPESNSKIEKYEPRNEPRNERPKEDAKPWTRKDRQELKQDKEKKELQPEAKQRKGETQQVKEKRPDVQQVREKKIQYRENVQQVREKKTQYREKLPSDPINNQQTKTSEPLPDKKKPKRHYVRIDNLTEEQKEKLKQKQPPPAREPEREKYKEKEKDFLSEDSN